MILTEQSKCPSPTEPGIDFNAAVAQFYEALYQFAYSLSGSASDAADLTQETYRVLLLKAGQIRDPEKLKSWLFTTLYREFLKGRRHVSRFPEVELDEAVNEIPLITAAAINELDAEAILSVVQALEEKYRAPVALFYLEDLSYKEIAEVLDLPIGTVMSRLSRGKAILRQALAQLFETTAPEPHPLGGGTPVWHEHPGRLNSPRSETKSHRITGAALALAPV